MGFLSEREACNTCTGLFLYDLIYISNTYILCCAQLTPHTTTLQDDRAYSLPITSGILRHITSHRTAFCCILSHGIVRHCIVAILRCSLLAFRSFWSHRWPELPLCITYASMFIITMRCNRFALHFNVSYFRVGVALRAVLLTTTYLG